MRRILLVLVMTLLLVIVAVEGTAIAQAPIEKEGCTGLTNAFFTQKDNANPGPSQGSAHSEVKAVGEEHSCGF